MQEILGKECLTSFYGMSLTSNKIWSMIQKKRTLIDIYTDVVTSDLFTLRIFVILFSDRHPTQLKSTCYAKHSHVKKIRERITNYLQNAISRCTIKDVMEQLCLDSICTDMEKVAQSVRPVKDCMIRKVKVLRMPKHDVGKFMELHTDSTQNDKPEEPPVLAGVTEVEREFVEPPVQATV